MQMKNVLDRLTELAKDNPSPDVKQAMENTRRMSVVEGADVVEVHEGAMDNDDEMTEDVRGLYYGDKGIRPPQTQAERDQIAGDIKQARTTNRADQTTTGYGDRVAPQLGAASSATPGQIGAKTTNAAGQTAFSTRSADPKYANYAGNIKTAAGAGKGVAEDSLNEDPVIQFASKAHDEWRKNFDPTGTKERIKKNSDGTEGNINVPFEELHPDWKKENLAAGQAAMMAVKRFPNNIEQAAEYIHNEWMKRNPKADYNAAQHVAYDQLPEDEKEKDRVHVRTMMALSGKQGVAEGLNPQVTYVIIYTDTHGHKKKQTIISSRGSEYVWKKFEQDNPGFRISGFSSINDDEQGVAEGEMDESWADVKRYGKNAVVGATLGAATLGGVSGAAHARSMYDQPPAMTQQQNQQSGRIAIKMNSAGENGTMIYKGTSIPVSTLGYGGPQPGMIDMPVQATMDGKPVTVNVFGRFDMKDNFHPKYGVIQTNIAKEGVAEGSRNAYLKHNNLVDLEKPLAGLEDEFNKFLRTHDPEVKQKYQQGIKDRIKTGTMAGPKGVLPEQGMAEAQLDEGAVDKLKELYQSLVSKVRTIPNFKQYYDAAKLKRQEVVDAIKTSKNAEELKQKIAAIAGSAPVMENFDPPPATASVTALAVGLFDTWAAQVVGVYSQMAVGTGMDILGGLILGVFGQVGCIGLALYYAIKANQLGKRNQDVAEGHFSDQDVQKKDKQYAGTKAYHAKNKAEKEKTATDAKTAFDAKFGGGNPASALKIREQSMTEGVNFAEMHRDKHTTLDEMLNELHDDINTFKQCGQMSEQLRDFMEVHHYGKKQLMDAAYGPVDEVADMAKLAGVQPPVTTAPAAGPELAESSGEMINVKEVDMYSLEVGGIDSGESPEFDNAYFEAGSFVDGTPLSDNELEQLTHERGDLVSELASEHMWAAGDDAHDRQRDLDMELEGVSDGDNGLASAHAKARRISGEHGVGQHVNRDPDSGHHHCSDWYVDGETVGSYNMGKRYDDSGYIDEEEMMPGEESDVAQKAQGIEAVSGKKINQMNPGEIKMAGQKVDAMGVTESKQMVDECGMMGGSMQPNTPANINISASAASGGEVAAMINDLLKLAGRPENAQAHMNEPGVVAIDGTMDAGGAEELAAMLGGEEEVVDETGDAGGFADATTQPDALVYDQNPVLTQTGVQKHTLGGYRNGDSPLAATTELEESLWRKFQNQ